MKAQILRKTGFAALLTSILCFPAIAAEPTVSTDIGTLDQESAEKAFPVLLSLIRRNFLTRTFFGDSL